MEGKREKAKGKSMYEKRRGLHRSARLTLDNSRARWLDVFL
jgi:hypothetical protein